MSKASIAKTTPANGKRLTPAQWAEADAFWQSGEHTLEQLSQRFGITRESLSRSFKKRGIERGSAAEQHAEKVREEVVKAATGDAALLAARIRETKEQHYEYTSAIRRMIMHELAAAAREKRPVATADPNLKALLRAIDGLAKVRNEAWILLGLDKDTGDLEDLPDLLISELTADEIVEIRNQSMDAAMGLLGDPELGDEEDDLDDVVVIEEGE